MKKQKVKQKTKNKTKKNKKVKLTNHNACIDAMRNAMRTTDVEYMLLLN